MKALMIVDMLYDFVDQRGALPVKGAGELVENIRKLRVAARQKGIPVIYANDAHDPDDKEFETWPRHCVRGEKGSEVVPDIAPGTGDIVIEKKDLSVFTSQKTVTILNELGTKELYISGVATDYCVRAATVPTKDKYGSPVKGAIENGYKVIIIVDAIEGVDMHKGDQFRALMEMGKFGAEPAYTSEILREWK
jgi:nicotinamidase-related amidase